MEQDSHPYSYKRSEHLKLRNDIEAVFRQNKVVRANPLKLIYAVEPADEFSWQVAFVAPKKIHHFAVDRNRNKRLMRESFRLNRGILTDVLGNTHVKLSFLLVAQNAEKLTYAEMEDRVRLLLSRLSEKVAKDCSNMRGIL